MLGFLSDVKIVVLLVITTLVYILWKKQRKGLPPGPTPIPVIGNILQLAQKDVLDVFRDYRKQYGDIFTVRLGSYTTIVVNGYDNLKEIFSRRGDEFSDRPHIFIHDELSRQKGIVGSSGQRWREQRAFALRTLKNFGVGKSSLVNKIKEEVDFFVQEINNLDGKPIDLKELLEPCVSNVICSIIFGRRFEHTDERFMRLTKHFDAMLEYSGHTGLITVFNFLKYIPGDLFKRKLVIQNANTIIDFVGELVAEHNKSYNENNIRDYIDAFLKEKKSRKNQPNSTFSDEQLLISIAELFFAGTETTASLIIWVILYLLNNPEVQDKIHQELDTVVGNSRDISLADRPNLPYCQAVITEAFRCSDMGPLSVQHAASRDTELYGFSIPKGTSFMPNLNSVHYDPDIFPEPSKFDPMRFIDENGKYCNHEKVIPFCIGKRVCLGEWLARAEIFLFLFSLLQRFSCVPISKDEIPPLKSKLGLTKAPEPFVFFAKRRD